MKKHFLAWISLTSFLIAAEPNHEKVLETLGNLKITRTEDVAEADYKFVKQQLNDFKDQHTQKCEDYLLIDQSLIDPDTQEPSTIAAYMKTAQTLFIPGLNVTDVFKKIVNLTAQKGSIQQCLYQIHVADKNDPDAKLCFQFFADNGFQKIQEFYNLEYDATTFYYSLKNIPKAWTSPAIPINSTPYTWIPYDQSLEDECEANFGFLIRDESNEEIVGGLFGTLRPEAQIPHADISDLWIREELRKQGLARKIMEYARDYLLEKSVKMIVLGTTDFGPWQLYERIGAKKVATDRGSMIHIDGSPVEVYCYHLDLSTLEKRS